MSATPDQRLEALETTIAYQEQAIEDLNGALALQQREIDALRREIARLAGQLSDVAAHPALAAEDEPPPPHY